MPKSRIYLFLLCMTLTGSGGVFFQKEWKQSRERCETAALLIRQANEVLDLNSETTRDPFVEFHAKPALLDPALERYKSAVHGLLAKKWSFHLKEAELIGFKKLEGAQDPNQALTTLAEIAAQPTPEKCPLLKDNTRVPASAPEFPLRVWLTDNQSTVDQSRALWSEDQETYCRTEKAHFTVFLAKRTMEERCAKSKKACKEAQFKQLETELAEVDHRLKLNREKIRKKWGERLAGRVICSQ